MTVVGLAFGQGKGAARLGVVQLGPLDDILDEDVEVGSAAFKEGLKLHVTGVGGGKMEAEGYPEVVEGKDKGRPKSVLIWCKISASRFESLAICSWT